MADRLYIGCDMDLTLTGMSVESSGSYLNAGTATWTLKTTSGTTVSSGSLSYVAASNGNYLGVMESTVTAGLTEGTRYHVFYTFSQSSYNKSIRKLFTAAYLD